MVKVFDDKDRIVNIIRLLLFEDESGEDMIPCSDLIFNEDGSYSFVVVNTLTGEKMKHTILTEEVE